MENTYEDIKVEKEAASYFTYYTDIALLEESEERVSEAIKRFDFNIFGVFIAFSITFFLGWFILYNIHPIYKKLKMIKIAISQKITNLNSHPDEDVQEVELNHF